MKSINFIEPVSPQKQKALTWWFYVSLFLFILLGATFMVISAMRRQAYYHLTNEMQEFKQQVSSFDNCAQLKHQLLAKKNTLEQRLHSVAQWHTTAAMTHDLLTMLTTITPPAICLTTCEAVPGSSLKLCGLSKNAVAVASFIELLNAHPQFSDIHLLELKPSSEKSPRHETLVQFSCAGSWKPTIFSNQESAPSLPA